MTEELILGGAPVAVVIMLVIQLAKSYGMPGKHAPLIAALLGIGAAIVIAFDSPPTTITGWIGVGVGGFVYGLAAMGMHSGAQSLQEVADKKELQKTAQQDQTKTETKTTATPEKVTTEVEVEPVSTPTEPPTVAGGSSN